MPLICDKQSCHIHFITNRPGPCPPSGRAWRHLPAWLWAVKCWRWRRPAARIAEPPEGQPFTGTCRFTPQNGLYRGVKRPVSRCKTAHLATPPDPWRNEPLGAPPPSHGHSRPECPAAGAWRWHQTESAAPGHASDPCAADSRPSPGEASVAVEPVGSPKLMAHDAQELLALLQYVEIYERNL